MSSPPSPTSITHSQFRHLLSLYPSTLKRVYGAKFKNDAKKLAQALDDDAWRYDAVVKVVEGRRQGISADGDGDGDAEGEGQGEGQGDSAGGWLEKAELERLVRWKITHGTYRPFLPAQIRKNDPPTVRSATSAGFASHHQTSTVPPSKGPKSSHPKLSLPKSSIPPFPTTPLIHLTTLTGVGPATATLLLSIHDPIHVPFFEDELFHWLCDADTDVDAAEAEVDGNRETKPTSKVKEKQKQKLKYSMKEYKELYEKVGVLRWRLGGGDHGEEVAAVEVEKVGFVVGCWDGGVVFDDDVVEGERYGKEVVVAEAVAVGGDGGEDERLEEKEKEAVSKKASGQKLENETGKAVPSGKTKNKRKAAVTATETSAPLRKSRRSR